MRWFLILLLLAGGAIVLAKENSSKFLVDSPSSIEEANSEPASKVENTVGEIKNSFKKFSKSESLNAEEEKLAEPQSLTKNTKQQEANFYEATVSQINQSKENVTDKVTAVVNCIEKISENNQ